LGALSRYQAVGRLHPARPALSFAGLRSDKEWVVIVLGSYKSVSALILLEGEAMKDQYAGDVSDVLKFAFLRALAGSDRMLGIAWYYVPGDDGRTDGRHLEWRDEPAWQRIDPELHACLSILSERSVAALERLIIWPKGCRFHREPVVPLPGDY
jgi:hypothetical protein